MAYSFPVREGEPVPKVRGRGNRKGCGRNLLQLGKMKPGDSIWNIPKKKMESFRFSAWRHGIKIRIRKLPHNNLYGIWRIS